MLKNNLNYYQQNRSYRHLTKMKSILRVCVAPKASGSHLVLAFQEINNEANKELKLKEAREVCLIKRVKNKSNTMQSR